MQQLNRIRPPRGTFYQMLSRNFCQCFGIVAGFLAVTIIFVIAFAVIAYCASDAQAEELSTMNNFVWSMLKVTLKQFDLQSLKPDQTLTLFILLFAVVMHYITLSVLILIALHVYFSIVDVGDFLSGRMGLRKWARRRQNDRVKDGPQDGLDDYQDIYKFLLQLRFTDSETENALRKIGVKQEKMAQKNATEDTETPGNSKEDGVKKTNFAETKLSADIVRSLQKEADETNKKIDIIIQRLNAVQWSANVD